MRGQKLFLNDKFCWKIEIWKSTMQNESIQKGYKQGVMENG